jgi:hypothetical protein
MLPVQGTKAPAGFSFSTWLITVPFNEVCDSNGIKQWNNNTYINSFTGRILAPDNNSNAYSKTARRHFGTGLFIIS